MIIYVVLNLGVIYNYFVGEEMKDYTGERHNNDIREIMFLYLLTFTYLLLSGASILYYMNGDIKEALAFVMFTAATILVGFLFCSDMLVRYVTGTNVKVSIFTIVLFRGIPILLSFGLLTVCIMNFTPDNFYWFIILDVITLAIISYCLIRGTKLMASGFPIKTT